MDRFRTHPVQLGIAVWLVLGSVAAVLIWQLDTSDRRLGSRLSAHGVTTLGTVTGTDAANHNTVFYSYVANGRTYHSGYFGRGPEGDASQLTVGQRIHVVYDSEDPSSSCYCSVADLAKFGLVANPPSGPLPCFGRLGGRHAGGLSTVERSGIWGGNG